jgi:hypothetical protein
VPLYERIVALDAEKAYSELKNQLFKQNSKLIVDEIPKHLVIEQGSLSGMTPKGIKKRVEYYFHPQGDHTRVVAKSSMASDWVKLNVASYVIAAALATVIFWVASDLRNNSVLGLFNQVIEVQNYSQALLLSNLLNGAATLILALIIISVIVDAYAYKRKYALVEESLKVLP